jgi:hypothetical protein
MVSLGRAGRPGRRCGKVQRLRTSERCHPRIVCGVTRNDPQRSRSTSRARRATRARSDQVKRGRVTWRRSTASWWRRNKDLSILGRSIRPVDANDLEHASEQTVEEGQGHGGSLTEGVLAGQTRSEGFWTLQVETLSGSVRRAFGGYSLGTPPTVKSPRRTGAHS